MVIEIRHAKPGYLVTFLIIAQMAATLLFVNQHLSMPIGLAIIIAYCGYETSKNMPVMQSGRWRWQMASFGFVTWGLMFAAIGYEDNFIGIDGSISSAFAQIKEIAFIIVLLPTTSNEESITIRALDGIQSGLFVAALGVLTWSSAFSGVIDKADGRYINTGHAAMIALVLISLICQTDKGNRKLVRSISIAIILYALISITSSYLATEYRLPSNSPAWVLGDLTFVAYIFSINYQVTTAYSVSWLTKSKPLLLQHFSPLLLAMLTTFLSFQLGSKAMLEGRIFGLSCLLVFALRTTLLLNKYLADRDKLIIAEISHSKLLIDLIHEVRAPLGSIVINASMLNQSGGFSDQQTTWVEQIESGSSRVTALMNDVLDIERLDAGQFVPVMSKCNIASIVDAAISVVSGHAESADIAVISKVYDQPVLVDPRLAERVVINLLMNSIRFTPNGGRIELFIGSQSIDTILLNIVDSGVGISPEVQATLFERFSHIGVPLRGNRGSGLGLAISQGIMASMGGLIIVKSETGKGAKFTISLKAAGHL